MLRRGFSTVNTILKPSALTVFDAKKVYRLRSE